MAYANLKMQSSDFRKNRNASSAFERLLALGSTHSDGAIRSNWQNAIKRV
jgi:hypothetical protein